MPDFKNKIFSKYLKIYLYLTICELENISTSYLLIYQSI